MKTDELPRILVIEDNTGLRTSLAKALESVSYTVRTGADGEEGVAIAREFKPHVVVCDMHLPNASGTSVLTTLRQEESFALSQFILMTGDLDGIPQRVGMDLGADDYLAKPFTVDEFLNCVGARLQRSQLYQKAEDLALLHFRETISHSLPHEVFTPLTGILGFTEVLRDEIGHIAPTEAAKMVNEIHAGAERLYRTLKNYLRILDVLNDRNSTSQVPERTRGIDTPGTIMAAADSVTSRYGRTENLIFTCDEVDMPLSSGDLSSIVIELVDNACKYSLKGEPVEVSLKHTADGITLSVTDHGRGMTPDQIKHIGAFRQFDRKKYEQQGLGLGLTLTQHLVQRHRGTFNLESSPGKGTTVTAVWLHKP